MVLNAGDGTGLEVLVGTDPVKLGNPSTSNRGNAEALLLCPAPAAMAAGD